MPSADVRRAYVFSIVENLLVDVESIVIDTDGFSIAEIKEILILMIVFGYNIKEAVNKLKSNVLS